MKSGARRRAASAVKIGVAPAKTVSIDGKPLVLTVTQDELQDAFNCQVAAHLQFPLLRENES